MDKKKNRAVLLKGTERDFKIAIVGMSPIKNVPDVNKKEVEWFIHPQTANIIHLVRIENMAPLEPRYCFRITKYHPEDMTGYNLSGSKQVKVDGKTYSLARLVALTFIPNYRPDRAIVRFKDGNKRNIRVDNLEWVKLNKKPKSRIKLNIHKRIS